MSNTIIPRTANVQRVGLARDLVRVVTVDIRSNVAAKGGGALHLAHGLRFKDGSRCSWFVTQADAQRFGWLG